MDLLKIKSNRLIESIKIQFKRYLYKEIDWHDRLIIITGMRGVGKTTLMLQRMKETYGNSPESIYISLDDLYFTEHTLSELTEQFVVYGGKHIFIDEIHKYPNWSKELKNIYDFYPDLKITATGSSALEIYKGEADLSRRASLYELHELSFREFLALAYKKNIAAISLDEIIENHHKYESEINRQIKPIIYFNEFLQQGAFPFILSEKKKYSDKVTAIINTIIETDLPATHKITFETIVKLKKLMYLISTSVPFKPNIKALSQKIGTSRDQLLKFIYYLEKSGLISALKQKGIANSIMTKPEKIYLGSSSLLYALDDRVNIGTARETYFFNQLKVKCNIHYSGKSDFLVEHKYTFEVGGPNKKQKQISGIKNAFIAADGIETGYNNVIPLWLFGFLY